MGAALPQAAFLFSIAGLSVTLVGFSGLVAALRRDAPRTALDAYRLRQIPEMALAGALIALVTLPLADVTGSATTAVRVASGLALVFTIVHMGVLYRRVRSHRIPLRGTNWIIAGSIDTALVAVGVWALISATAGSYEWLLVLLITRPALAFVMALTDVTAG